MGTFVGTPHQNAAYLWVILSKSFSELLAAEVISFFAMCPLLACSVYSRYVTKGRLIVGTPAVWLFLVGIPAFAGRRLTMDSRRWRLASMRMWL